MVSTQTLTARISKSPTEQVLHRISTPDPGVRGAVLRTVDGYALNVSGRGRVETFAVYRLPLPQLTYEVRHDWLYPELLERIEDKNLYAQEVCETLSQAATQVILLYSFFEM